MTVRRSPTRRLMRGEQLRPGRYWTRFLISSIVVHALTIGILSGMVESFFQNLQKPKPAPSVVYVGLLFPPPQQVTVTKTKPKEPISEEKPRTEAAKRKPEASTPEKKSGEPKPSKPSLSGLIGPAPERPKSAKPPVVLKKQVRDEAPRIKSSERRKRTARTPARNVVEDEPAVRAAPRIEAPTTKTVTEGPTISVPEPGPKTVETRTAQQAGTQEPDFTADVADRSYVEFFEPSTDTITIIKADETTTVAKSDIARPGPIADTLKPVIRHITKDYMPPDSGPAPKAPEALSSVSIKAGEVARVEVRGPVPASTRHEKAPVKVTLAKPEIAEPGPITEVKQPAVEHLSKVESLPDKEPVPKAPEALSGFSIAARESRHESTVPDESTRPLINIDMADLAPDNNHELQETETPYPALLGIKGLRVAPPPTEQLNLPTNIIELFEGLFSDYSPSGNRPEPLESRSIGAADIEPGSVPPVETERLQTDIAPAMTARAAVPEHAAIQELPTRMPPKVIEVSGYENVSGEPPTITITNPAPGKTDRSLVEVRGEVTGRGIGSVLFSMGGFKRELLVSEGVFSTTVALEKGRNVLNAATADYFGRAARSRVVVDYSPGDEKPIISFITPKDGDIIDAFRDREFEISGTVNSEDISFVRVYLNRSIKELPVVDGGFSFRTLAAAEENTLYAEAFGSGVTFRSDEIRFRVINLFPKDISVLLETDVSAGVKLTHRWRPQPETDEVQTDRAPGFIDSAAATGLLAEVEYAESGVYTIGASFELDPGVSVRAVFHVTLFGYDPSKKISRSLGPFVLRGKGYLPAVRVLMPECVFWEDDYWFSGMIESSSGTTKFKEPEGITWREED